MKIIEPSFSFETPMRFPIANDMLRQIEAAARTCYKSEEKATADSASPFVRKISQINKHESVIEHVSVSVRFVVDRGVSHELVRHRLAAFSQESTRYCNYCNKKFGREITVIRPPFWSECDDRYHFWKKSCETAERMYLALLDYKASPQEARSVLPNSLKTELVMTCNLREWKHVLKLRTSPQAHPQMRQVMVPLLESFRCYLPEIFDDIPVNGV